MMDIQAWYRDEFLPKLGKRPPLWAQALNVVGEAGEFAEAFRRESGNARRVTSHDETMLELADVVIAAYGFAALTELHPLHAGERLDRYIEEKIRVIMSRGFGNQAKSCSCTPDERSYGACAHG